MFCYFWNLKYTTLMSRRKRFSDSHWSFTNPLYMLKATEGQRHNFPTISSSVMMADSSVSLYLKTQNNKTEVTFRLTSVKTYIWTEQVMVDSVSSSAKTLSSALQTQLHIELVTGFMYLKQSFWLKSKRECMITNSSCKMFTCKIHKPFKIWIICTSLSPW